jgi:hypothetical protein
MSLKYASLLSNYPLKVCETPQQYLLLTERHLQAMWFEQKYFKSLTTKSGEIIEILSPGIWNSEAGPDFLKAHIRIGSKEFRGDIEMHFADESWFHHQHHLDSRYDQVILHISLWLPIKPKSILTKNGSEPIQTYLENHLTLPHARIVQLIDLDLYPYKKFIGSGRCSQTLFKILPEEKINTFFKNAAEWRLTRKKAYLASHTESPDKQLGAGIAMALGYKNNADSFFNLFLWLSRFHFTNSEDYLAMALKACGYFDDIYKKKWKDSNEYKALNVRFENLNIFDIPRFKMNLNQIRPLNNPLRRLVYLSKFLTLTQNNLYNQLIELWNSKWVNAKSKKDWKKLQDGFCDLIPSYTDTYWNHHFSFETEIREAFLPLIGEDLKKEIVVNTVLALIHSAISETNNVEELKDFENFYGSISASKTSKTRYLTHRFFGETPKGAILNRAFAEQGAYQLHHDFCIHYEASCEGCPFEERYKNAF